MSLLSQANRLVKEAQTNKRLPPDFSIEDAIGVTLRPLQEQLQDNLRRFNVLVLHRRFGKTVLCLRYLIRRAWYCPHDHGRYAYIGPTYSQTEDIAWSYLKQFTENIPGIKVEQGKLAIWVPTKRGTMARIRLYGVDSPKQRLRGLYLDGVVLDEYADIPPSVWSQQVRPMLSDKERGGVDENGEANQWAIFIGTPRGRNHFYRVFANGLRWFEGLPVDMLDPDTGKEEAVFRQDWYAAKFAASETEVLSRAELKAALLDLQSHEGIEEGQAIYEQEYECSFDAAVRGSIYAAILKELRDRGRITNVPYNPNLPVHTCWDLGWDDATAIWFFQIVGGKPAFIDYYENSGADLRHYADLLADKGYRYGKHLLPHDVEVHELGTGKTRAKILKELGVRVTTVPKHSLWDGIAATKRWLLTGYFDATKCMDGLDRLALYRREWDEKNQVYRQQPVHDWASHAADAIREGAEGVRQRFIVGSSAYDEGPDPNTAVSAEL